jgi:two-component sensor histidine kinase
LLVSLAWLGPATLAVLRPFLQHSIGNRPTITWQDVVWEGADWLIYGFLTPVVFYLARRFPLRQDRLKQRIAIHFLFAMLLCGAWSGGGTLLAWVIYTNHDPLTLKSFVGWFLTSLPFGVAVYFCVLGIEHAVYYFVESREREHQLAEARLGALRMQMQPHFLYNSLNAITVIVRDRDHATATRMLELLGDMLHRVMRTDRPQEVRLAEELEFLKQFLSIEQIRFSDRLHPEFEVDPELRDAVVPDFILQPLVENALRHGLAKKTGSTRLVIAARREGKHLVLTVTDDGPGPEPGAQGREGVGLTNTRERLATLYGGEASLRLETGPAGGAVATLRLPYRTRG